MGALVRIRWGGEDHWTKLKHGYLVLTKSDKPTRWGGTNMVVDAFRKALEIKFRSSNHHGCQCLEVHSFECSSMYLTFWLIFVNF
jgi:hypothetical protein